MCVFTVHISMQSIFRI